MSLRAAYRLFLHPGQLSGLQWSYNGQAFATSSEHHVKVRSALKGDVISRDWACLASFIWIAIFVRKIKHGWLLHCRSSMWLHVTFCIMLIPCWYLEWFMFRLARPALPELSNNQLRPTSSSEALPSKQISCHGQGKNYAEQVWHVKHLERYAELQHREGNLDMIKKNSGHLSGGPQSIVYLPASSIKFFTWTRDNAKVVFVQHDSSPVLSHPINCLSKYPTGSRSFS